MQLKIQAAEYEARQARLMGSLKKEGFLGFLTFSPLTVLYLTGFHFLSTERPAALVIPVDGPRFLFVPQLEIDHAKRAEAVDEIVTYPEYPDAIHPMEHLGDAMKERGLGSGAIVSESPGYGSAMGYRGPRIDEVLEDIVLSIDSERVETMRMVKSSGELALMHESARWGNLAHTLLQEHCAPGQTENQVSLRATEEATVAMMKTLGARYYPLGQVGASAIFRGQIGPNSALPHAVNINAVMHEGDTLVTGAGAGVGGYGSELERTMFLGEPSSEQVTYFHHMVALQDVALSALRPGIACSEVDRAVRAEYESRGLTSYWLHHVGHAMGLLGHEAPFLDIGDSTIIEPGMVFCVEPGLYVSGLGGFRHSDTVVITDAGFEFITYYPRQLEDLIIPV